MQLSDAVELLADSGVGSLGPTTWADLGCGNGTFTLALAELLAPGSTIHAIDRDSSALRQIPTVHREVSIATYRGDFTSDPWPFAGLDGVLMANSLHYVADQPSFIRACQPRMNRRRFLIVEYDTETANRWVPYPVAKRKLTALFETEGYPLVTFLGSRRSVYRRAALYAAIIT